MQAIQKEKHRNGRVSPKAISRRQAVGALLGLPVALGSRARAQQSTMDIRVIEGVISCGGGIFNALKAGISPSALNTEEMLGMHCGLIEQLRRFGGIDDYLTCTFHRRPRP